MRRPFTVCVCACLKQFQDHKQNTRLMSTSIRPLRALSRKSAWRIHKQRLTFQTHSLKLQRVYRTLQREMNSAWNNMHALFSIHRLAADTSGALRSRLRGVLTASLCPTGDQPESYVEFYVESYGILCGIINGPQCQQMSDCQMSPALQRLSSCLSWVTH